MDKSQKILHWNLRFHKFLICFITYLICNHLYLFYTQSFRQPLYITVGVFILLFWIKGRQLRFVSDEWDSYFLTLPNAKVQKYVMGIYLTAAVIASVITFFILLTAGYQHSLELAVLFFTGGLMAAACRWHKKYKEYILRRWREIIKKPF